MSTAPPKLDLIRTRHFSFVEVFDRASSWLFYAGVILSLLAVFVDKTANPVLYSFTWIAFASVAFAMFFVGHLNRLYLTPRAEDRRRKDFFSNACGVNLTHETTVGYYNNNFANPIKKIAAQLLENSLFSKEIIRRMAVLERGKMAFYFVLWFAVLLYRDTDLSFIVGVAQTLLSEQILSRYFRLEALRMRVEETFSNMYTLFQSPTNASNFFARTLDSLVMYEAAKAAAGITMCSKIFDRINADTSEEWNDIKTRLLIPGA